MSKSIVKNSLYLLFCSFLLFSFLAPNSGYALDRSEIQLQSIYINKSSCFISISGITANCTSSLNTRSSTKLSIKMELQKKKSARMKLLKRGRQVKQVLICLLQKSGQLTCLPIIA